MTQVICYNSLAHLTGERLFALNISRFGDSHSEGCWYIRGSHQRSPRSLTTQIHWSALTSQSAWNTWREGVTHKGQVENLSCLLQVELLFNSVQRSNRQCVQCFHIKKWWQSSLLSHEYIYVIWWKIYFHDRFLIYSKHNVHFVVST